MKRLYVTLAISATSLILIGGIFAVASDARSKHLAKATSCFQTSVSQSQLDLCVHSTLLVAQTNLQRQVKAASKLYPARSVASSQLAWKTYMVNECRLQSSPHLGGSIYQFMDQSCQLSLTQQRIRVVRLDLSLWDH